MNQKKIGLIGLDTSHVRSFAQKLNNPDDPHHVPGGRVVAGYRGETPDWERSAGRVDQFTDLLRDEFEVEILDDPAAVAQRVDLVFITSADGRKHRQFVEQVVGAGKPIFVDKPFATTYEDAQAMLWAARDAGVPLMSTSPRRYTEMFQQALADETLGPIVGLDLYGPMEIDSVLPGVCWYGCHGIEMMVAAMGVGCEEVRAIATQNSDQYVMRWADGRLASYRGIRQAHHQFGTTIHRAQGVVQHSNLDAAGRPKHAALLEAILNALPNGRSAVPEAQMLEVVRVMEACNEARLGQTPIGLSPQAPHAS